MKNRYAGYCVGPWPYKFFIILLLGMCGISVAGAMQTGKVCFKKNCVAVDIVESLEEKSKGLQGREKLTDRQGMFFVFDPVEVPVFWMKDMLTAIDMIWLDEKSRVIAIHHSVPACKTETCLNYSSGKPTKWVLEVNAGLAKKWNLKEGDELKIK